MSVLTVCKNVIASNNKCDWHPDKVQPPIRIAKTKSGGGTDRAFTVGNCWPEWMRVKDYRGYK